MSVHKASLAQPAQADDKIIVENVNIPGHTTRVNAQKYHAMCQASLNALPANGPGLT
jgi:hypothetical protein